MPSVKECCSLASQRARQAGERAREHARRACGRRPPTGRAWRRPPGRSPIAAQPQAEHRAEQEPAAEHDQQHGDRESAACRARSRSPASRGRARPRPEARRRGSSSRTNGTPSVSTNCVRPRGEQVDAEAARDLVGAEAHGHERVERRRAPRPRGSPPRPSPRRSRSSRRRACTPSAPCSMMPSSAMLMTPPRSLKRGAERGERVRHADAQRRRDEQQCVHQRHPPRHAVDHLLRADREQDHERLEHVDQLLRHALR